MTHRQTRTIGCFGLLLVLALVAAPSSIGGAATPSADYEVTFEATWSMQTHPDGFPPSPHFSPLVGGTHNSMVLFWESGGLATFGMERMAEDGIKTDLENEVGIAIGTGTAGGVISGNGISPSPGSVSVLFTASEDYPFLTLVSMLAPSPDWFVGVSGYDLMNGSEWIDSATVDLYVYDAGTDSGPSYTSPNQDTNPQDPIAMVTGPSFSGVPVGTYSITRTDLPQPVPALGWVAQMALAVIILLASRELRFDSTAISSWLRAEVRSRGSTLSRPSAKPSAGLRAADGLRLHPGRCGGSL